MVIATVFAIGNSSDVFLILRAQQVGIPAVMIPAVYFTFNLVYSLSAVPAGMAADKFGMKRVILTGFVLFACLYYGFAVAGTPPPSGCSSVSTGYSWGSPRECRRRSSLP